MIDIIPLPAFDDNYIWMIGDFTSNRFVAVDPGDEDPVLEWLRSRGGELSAVLLTHHHYDHIGGVPELLQAYPTIPVYGSVKDRIAGVNRPVKEGDRVPLPGLNTDLEVMEVPGHTAGHVAYYGQAALFCGDTLFAAGCGRVFDGTFEQLADSLQRIAALPGDTRIYCAHEYTLANLGFAAWVEPQSEALKQRLQADRARRENNEPTLPSTLSLELAT
ncbi:MAG: hydroxyacylglutathione hydrolase, partial [Gammaproteobacteria bacterium]|nr:hydroxyacylglutathione hydrolase [Gammaproteobacteria bacterium]